jgi:hypothetical protein
MGQSDRSDFAGLPYDRQNYTPGVLPIRRRTPSERVAYCQGYLAGLTSAETTSPENAKILRESMEANLRAAQEECDD